MTAHDKKPSNKKKPINRWSVYGSIVGIFIALNMTVWALTGLITYPTTAHRETAAHLAEMTNQAYMKNTPEEMDKAFQSPGFKHLQSLRETRYSNGATILLTIAQLVGWVALIGFAYNYLRKRRIGKDQAMTIALFNGIASMITFPIMALLSDVFYPTGISSFPGVDTTVVILAGLPFVFIFSTLVAYLVARIFQWRYNRKYNFAVE